MHVVDECLPIAEPERAARHRLPRQLQLSRPIEGEPGWLLGLGPLDRRVVARLTARDRQLTLASSRPLDDLERLAAWARRRDTSLEDLEVRRTSLEDVYLRLTAAGVA